MLAVLIMPAFGQTSLEEISSKCPMIKTPSEPNPLGAPLMQNPEITSSGKCRGACGEDCPSDRCEEVEDIEIPIADMGDHQAVCVYSGVIECPTHQGCRDHDACYDECAAGGNNSLIDDCHLKCNDKCFDTYGECQCAAWADILPGQIQSAVESGCEMKYDGYLKFFLGKPEIKLVPKYGCTEFKVPPMGWGGESWFNTGINILPGQNISIIAYGTVQPNSGSVSCGPEGTFEVDYWLTDYSFRSDWGHDSLIGRIGAEGVPIFIGTNSTFTAREGGELWLGVNDKDPGNNAGEYVAKVCWGDDQ